MNEGTGQTEPIEYESVIRSKDGALRVEGSIQGPVIVCSTSASFPPRCVFCNQPEVRRVTRKFVIFPRRSSNRLMWLSNIAITVHEVFRHVHARRGSAQIGLCKQHSARRRLEITGLIVVLLAMVAVAASGTVLANMHYIASGDGMYFYATAAAVFIGCVLWAAKHLPLLCVQGIKDGEMRLLGAGKPFLDSIRGSTPAGRPVAAVQPPPRPARAH